MSDRPVSVRCPSGVRTLVTEVWQYVATNSQRQHVQFGPGMPIGPRFVRIFADFGPKKMIIQIFEPFYKGGPL